MTEPAPFLTHSDFTAPSIQHGFFGREGGVSTGVYARLNCSLSSHDNPDHIRENRTCVAAAFGQPYANLVTCYQTHSVDVHHVEKPWDEATRPKGDALVTNKPNIILAIGTADCGPVLFHDSQAGVIGAAHAGWKGALGGVLENTITAMIKLGATTNTIHACIGPCIQQNSYEVGPEFPAAFLAQSQSHMDFFKPSPRPTHFLFDLPAYLTARLKKAGVMQVHSIGNDTCSDEKRFFSYRRRCHRKEADMGTQLSTITLPKAQ